MTKYNNTRTEYQPNINGNGFDGDNDDHKIHFHEQDPITDRVVGSSNIGKRQGTTTKK